MEDPQNKALSRPIFRRDVNWEPFPNWTQPNRIFGQDFGLPPLLEPNDLTWIDWAKRRLADFSWPGYTQSPLLALFGGQQQPPPVAGLRQLSADVSEIRAAKDSWRICLDVSHFSPEEIAITTKMGYLEISGNHEERQDEHGSVSRNFTRKYKLPPGVDLQHISSLLSGDGVLSVEAPVAGTATSHPATEVVIPIQQSSEKV
ncbi:hypothetical protein CRUP_029294 [Coryphaenoides rupestris]|nr:hypothetical protein CRUP_029294 [Coryphaenoides rupestris]